MSSTGKIKQIIGPIVDVSFEDKDAKLPKILNALQILRPNGEKVILECQQHLGEDAVRCIAMEATDGLTRGMDVLDLGSPITMPTGESIKGRLFNVVGDSIDGIDLAVNRENGMPIHRKPPRYEDL